MARNSGSQSEYKAYIEPRNLASLGLYIDKGLADLLHKAGAKDGLSRDAYVRRELTASVNATLGTSYVYPEKANLAAQLEEMKAKLAAAEKALEEAKKEAK